MKQGIVCAAKPWKPLRLMLAGSLFVGAADTAQAATYEVIHRFDLNTVGPLYGDLVADADGRLYGSGQGHIAVSNSPGYVFRLDPPTGAGKAWSAVTYPVGSATYMQGYDTMGGVTLVDGSVFGVNAAGGVLDSGSVFRIDSLGTVSVVYDFVGGQVRPYDGTAPVAGMIEGPGKLLYGTTMYGGSRIQEAGTVYSVSPSLTKPGYRVLHRFGVAGDGLQPGNGRLALDPQGRLFGVTGEGGIGFGTIYMLQRLAGRWTEQVIYPFGANDPYNHPRANVVLDNAGNLYSCSGGSSLNKGGVYRIAPPAQDGGAWTYSVIYSFGPAASEPDPGAGCAVTIDTGSGKLFGTSYHGGTHGFGTIWELDSPAAEGAPWIESVLHSFDGSAADGGNPVAPPFKLGDSYYGGNLGGVVYKVTP